MTTPTAFPAAFLFDLDGTLVDSERENVESVVLAARQYGVELSAEERAFVIGHSWNEIYTLVTQNHDWRIPMRELIDRAADERTALFAKSGFRALPGAVATVRRLAARAKLAVVSGASRREVAEAIAGIGVADAFALVVAAEDYPRGKPAPDPYAQAMAALGVEPARALAIEDATPGILSARAAGVRVIAVRAGNFAGYDLSAADLVVDTLAEVTDEVIAKLVA
jgi:HAD superfamily hydrolase (TIGR01509 family)